MRGLAELYPMRGHAERELAWLQEDQLAQLARDAAQDVPVGCSFQLSVSKGYDGRCEATLYASTSRLAVDATLLAPRDGNPAWAAKSVSLG
jgi:hypothetical protein